MRLSPICLLPFALLPAQEIRDTSFRAPNGERVQRLEIVVPTTLERAWDAVSSSQGWMNWMAPTVDMELKPLGKFQSNYRAGSKPGDPGTIYNTVLAYVPLRMFAMKIGLNDAFPAEVRDAGSLFSVLTMEEAGPNRVRLSEMMLGWRDGPAWDEAWSFFDKGNRYTFQQLYRHLAQVQPPAAAPGRPAIAAPKPGVCPLPILPALPSLSDSAFYARSEVPHGRVEQPAYRNYLGDDKRMHVYLPPDYDRNTSARYPVLYLNHGGGDDDARWTSGDPRSGGHANSILDNLIGAGKARPMIVVMPNTRACASADPPALGSDDKCSQEFLKDIIPYVDAHYRTEPRREARALAGLSMGGFVVMHTGLPHLETFSELYIYSSGHIGEPALRKFDENFSSLLKDPATNGLFRVPLYIAAGETDIALKNGQKDLALFNAYGLRNFWVLSTGGHEWANWRRYLWQTAQIMFPVCPTR